MGISGKAEKLLDLDLVKRDNIAVIKRFSGGGTVVIDPLTVFVTLICNAKDCDVAVQPRPILEWTEALYRPLFPSFALRENDYVFGDKKFGGNAQYIQKRRWLHHTSFLWDYDPEKMNYLLLPEKRPEYRKDRRHVDFLCKLRPLFPKKEMLVETLMEHFQKELKAKKVEFSQIRDVLNSPHRKSTIFLSVS